MVLISENLVDNLVRTFILIAITQGRKKLPAWESRLSSIAIQARVGGTIFCGWKNQERLLIGEKSSRVQCPTYKHRHTGFKSKLLLISCIILSISGARFLHLQHIGDSNCFIGSLWKLEEPIFVKQGRIMPGKYHLSICLKKKLLNRTFKSRKKIAFWRGEKWNEVGIRYICVCVCVCVNLEPSSHYESDLNFKDSVTQKGNICS